MVHTKKHDLTDGAGAVIPPPQPPQPIGCRHLRHPFHCRPGGCSALTSPGKGTATDVNADIDLPTPRSLRALKLTQGRGRKHHQRCACGQCPAPQCLYGGSKLGRNRL